MLKIIFLGTGDALNNGGKAHQSVWIQAENQTILIDCGPTTLYTLQKYHSAQVQNIDAIVFTHLHGDHFLGTLFLDLALDRVWKRSNNIIYAGVKGLEQHFLQNYHLSYPGLYPNPQSNFTRIFREYEENITYNLFDDQSFLITPIPMKHGNIVSYGYRILVGKYMIAISGDTEWNDNIPILCQNSDLAILECKFHQKKSACDHHLSWEEIISHIDLLQTKKILLTHVGKEILQTTDPAISSLVCKDGDEIVLSY